MWFDYVIVEDNRFILHGTSKDRPRTVVEETLLSDAPYIPAYTEQGGGCSIAFDPKTVHPHLASSKPACIRAFPAHMVILTDNTNIRQPSVIHVPDNEALHTVYKYHHSTKLYRKLSHVAWADQMCR